MKLLKLSFLLLSLLSTYTIKVNPSQAQDSFASRCYLTGSTMRASGEGATKYAFIYLGYEICAYYRFYEPIMVKGSDGTVFEVPKLKKMQTCINEMRNNKSKTCLDK